MVRVPQSCSQLVARERHKKPPAEAGEEGSREPAASCRSSLSGPPPAHNQPGPPGLEFPQEAPGGSRGTPGRMPSLVPCDVGLNREFPAVIRHGRRGGFHARSPRVSTRGFLDDRFPIQRICKTTVASGFAHLTIRASRQRRWRGHRVAENGRRGGRRTLDERVAAAATARRLLPPPKPAIHQSRLRSKPTPSRHRGAVRLPRPRCGRLPSRRCGRRTNRPGNRASRRSRPGPAGPRAARSVPW